MINSHRTHRTHRTVDPYCILSVFQSGFSWIYVESAQRKTSVLCVLCDTLSGKASTQMITDHDVDGRSERDDTTTSTTGAIGYP